MNFDYEISRSDYIRCCLEINKVVFLTLQGCYDVKFLTHTYGGKRPENYTL